MSRIIYEKHASATGKEWGDFREKTGIKVIRANDLQLTIHPIPHIKYTIGYLPKGPLPTEQMLIELKKIGENEKCVFIQLEPNVENVGNLKVETAKFRFNSCRSSPFYQLHFCFGFNQIGRRILKICIPKPDITSGLPKKKGVKVVEDNSGKAFAEYLKLTKETTQRQNFYAHSEKYHRLMWRR